MVFVIIVNWNTGDLLRKCLESLQQLSEVNLISKVIVVDNDSKDDSVFKAKALASSGDLELVFEGLDYNAGFARANNIAWKKAGENDHVLLLNPDTEMKSGSLQAMVNELEGSADVGVVGPKLVNSDGSWQPSVRKFPSGLIFLWLLLKLNRLLPMVYWWQDYMQVKFNSDKRQEVDQVMGAVFLIKNEVWRRVGKLDENFFLWFEEVDYCKRVKDEGWKVVYTAVGEVMHHKAASFDQVVGWRKTWPFLKSSLYYARKNLGLVAWVGLWLLIPVSVLLLIPAITFHLIRKWRK